METPSPTLTLILSSAYFVSFQALLYIIGRIGLNVKKIRRY